MKRPKIHIVNIHGVDWGIKDVTQLNWDQYGNIDMLYVDFMGNYSDLMLMRYDPAIECFVNTHGNLRGNLID